MYKIIKLLKKTNYGTLKILGVFLCKNSMRDNSALFLFMLSFIKCPFAPLFSLLLQYVYIKASRTRPGRIAYLWLSYYYPGSHEYTSFYLTLIGIIVFATNDKCISLPNHQNTIPSFQAWHLCLTFLFIHLPEAEPITVLLYTDAKISA